MCSATIQVHKGVQVPLLSYAHCKKLAIISQDFPKPMLEVKHVKTLSSTISPVAAKEHFLKEFGGVLVFMEDLKSVPPKTQEDSP